MYGNPTYMKGSETGKKRSVFHPELRNFIGAWGFQGQEGHG